MKKIVLMSAGVMMLSSMAFAQAKKAEAPKEIACAVMTSNKVNIAEATKKKMFADYKGKRYFFCCEGCPAAFAKEKDKYAKAPSIPTPKAGKKA